MNRKTVQILISVLLPFMLLQSCATESENSDTGESGFITIEIDYKTAKSAQKFPNVQWKSGMTVAEAMKSKGFELDYEVVEYAAMGTLVTSLGGVKNDDLAEHYWQFCVDGVVSESGINAKKVAKGGTISWHFAKYAETPCKKIGE